MKRFFSAVAFLLVLTISLGSCADVRHNETLTSSGVNSSTAIDRVTDAGQTSQTTQATDTSGPIPTLTPSATSGDRNEETEPEATTSETEPDYVTSNDDTTVSSSNSEQTTVPSDTTYSNDGDDPYENAVFTADFTGLASETDQFAYFISEGTVIGSLKELTKQVHGNDNVGWGGTGSGIVLDGESFPSYFILRDDNLDGELTFSARYGMLRILAFKAPTAGEYRYSCRICLWNDDNRDSIRASVVRQGEMNKELKSVPLNMNYSDVVGSVYLEEGEYLYIALSADEGVWNYGSIASFSVALLNRITEDGLYSWISSPYDKISPSQTSGSALYHELYMGKNEKEGFQISLRSGKSGSYRLKLTSELPGGVSCTLNKVYKTVRINGELYADTIGPMKNGTVTIEPNDTASVYVEFEAEANAATGVYLVTFDLTRNGITVCSYTVKLTVWSFAYSDTPTFKTTVGLNKYAIALEKGYINGYYESIPKQYEDEVMELYLAYYEYMLDNRISPIQLPYDILDPRADKYMSDPRLTSFSVPTRYPTDTTVWGDYISDATLSAYYEKLSSNPEWLEKAYIYPVDEPTSKAHLDEILGQLERYKRLAPNLRVATSFFMNFNYGNGKDAVDILAENLTMLSIKTCTFNGDDCRYGIAPVNGKTLADRMKEYVKNGGEMWTYICWEPGEPYANMYVNEDGIDHRLSMWQQYDLGAVGFLYWDCTYWECVDDPWKNMATVPWVSSSGISPVHGDGSLLYPGHRIGVYGACGSLRFFAVRDGVEDVMLLKIAEELFGREWVDSMIDRVSTSVTEFTRDSELFDSVRAEIGNAVSRAYS